MKADANLSRSPNRYFDRHFACEAVKILPGEFYATAENTLIVTVLGSCVSVCLRDPLTGVSGMNHFLLPFDETEESSSATAQSRYGEFAIDLLIDELVKLGAKKRRLEAKVFGAGNVLQGLNLYHVGPRNADFVMRYLRDLEIPILASDLLDQFPRKVYFFPETGEVKVKKIKSLNNTTILDRESEYRLRMRQKHD